MGSIFIVKIYIYIYIYILLTMPFKWINSNWNCKKYSLKRWTISLIKKGDRPGDKYNFLEIYWFWLRTLLGAFKKDVFAMKIEPMACIWIFECTMIFRAARNDQKWSCWLFRPNLCELGLFRPYFACWLSFREISMITMVICGQNKLFWLI